MRRIAAEDAAQRARRRRKTPTAPDAPSVRGPPGHRRPHARIGTVSGQGGRRGQGRLLGKSAAQGDEDVQTGQLVGPMVRDGGRLGAAFQIWRGAPRTHCRRRAEGGVRDRRRRVAINDLLSRPRPSRCWRRPPDGSARTRPARSPPNCGACGATTTPPPATASGPQSVCRGRADRRLRPAAHREHGLARRPCPFDRGVHQAEAVRPGGRGDSGVAAGVSHRRRSTAT